MICKETHNQRAENSPFIDLRIRSCSPGFKQLDVLALWLKQWGGMREEMVLYLHALDSNGNKRAECNFENNSWDRQEHLGRKISISLWIETQIAAK